MGIDLHYQGRRRTLPYIMLCYIREKIIMSLSREVCKFFNYFWWPGSPATFLTKWISSFGE